MQNLLNICNNTEPILKKLLTRLGVMYNDWWLLSFLQHYGASSPLLDFSRNHEVALFFACKDMDEETSKNDINNYCSIYYYDYKEVCRDITATIKKHAEIAAKYMLNNKQNNTNIWKRQLSFKEVISKAPTHTVILPSYSHKTNITNHNKEVVTTYTIANFNEASQEGEFVCNINIDTPLENIFQKTLANGNVKKYIHCFDIHKSLRDYIIQEHLGGSLAVATMNYFPSEQGIAQKVQQLWLEKLKV